MGITNGTGALDRSAILGVHDREVVAIEMPEWGGRVYLRSITAAVREKWEIAISGEARRVNIRAKYLILALCNEDGDLLFDDNDILKLDEKAAAPMERLFDVALRMNGMHPDSAAELEKNSPAGPAGASPSSSPLLSDPQTASPVS